MSSGIASISRAARRYAIGRNRSPPCISRRSAMSYRSWATSAFRTRLGTRAALIDWRPVERISPPRGHLCHAMSDAVPCSRARSRALWPRRSLNDIEADKTEQKYYLSRPLATGRCAGDAEGGYPGRHPRVLPESRGPLDDRQGLGGHGEDHVRPPADGGARRHRDELLHEHAGLGRVPVQPVSVAPGPHEEGRDGNRGKAVLEDDRRDPDPQGGRHGQ